MYEELKPVTARADVPHDAMNDPPLVELGEASDFTNPAEAARKIIKTQGPTQAVSWGHNCRMG